jgi:BolA protein
MEGYDASAGFASSLDFLKGMKPRQNICRSLHDFFIGTARESAQHRFLPLTPVRTRRKTPSMLVKDDITRKLKEAFAPDSVEVIDESDQHHGHAGHRPGGQTHFRVYIVSKAFAGKSRLDRHRMINQTLADNLSGGVHALAIHADAPGD